MTLSIDGRLSELRKLLAVEMGQRRETAAKR